MACTFCGLPTPLPRDAPDVDDADVYCCLGCRIAAGIMGGEETAGNRSVLTRLGLAVFFAMNVMVFTMVLWSWNIHDIQEDSQVLAFRELLRYACLLFSTPVLILLGGPLVESSWESCRHGRFTTDVLLLLGVCAAFAYSAVSLVYAIGDVYFEVVCMILVAVTLGKWLEATAKQKATQALRSLRQLLPDTVRRQATGSHETEAVIPIDAAQAGDTLRVLAGERIPVDGIVASPNCTVDEQVITGESIPQTKTQGQSIFGGSLNLNSELYLRATSCAATGAIARLMQEVEKSTASQCRVVRSADRLAAWFVPLIVFAAGYAIVQNASVGGQQALMSALAVVLIACPCALGIATPLALWVAITSAAQRGVLFRSGDAVIQLARLRSIAFDKTGTITGGDVRVVSTFLEQESERSSFFRISKQLAASSNHVLAKSILAHLCITQEPSAQDEAPANQHSAHSQQQVCDVAGKGLKLSSDGVVQMLGSPAFAAELGMQISAELTQTLENNVRLAVACVGWGGQVRGAFFLGEVLRPETTDVFKQLNDRQLDLTILTGDRPQRALAMQRATGVRTIGQLLPQEKAEHIRQLPHPTAMVGDGINDALALTEADVGIALDCGTDVSRDIADICLLGNTLENLPWAIELAKQTQVTIRRNLVWAVSYNIVGIGFAASGNLNPIIAAVAMVGSSLFVLTSSLRLAQSQGNIVDVPSAAATVAAVPNPTTVRTPAVVAGSTE